MYDTLVSGAAGAGQVLLVAVLPVAVLFLGERLIHALDTVEYHAVPGLARFSVLSGLIAGALLVWVNHEPSWYDIDTVFDPNGPWAVPLIDLFRVWLDPTRYSPWPLWERVEPLDLDDPITVLALVSAGLAALAVLGALRFFGLRAPRALVANTLVWWWGAALAVYVVCASAWALNMLNFWAVFVTFFIYRYYGLKGH